MLNSFFGKRHGYRRFNYTPRYYDPRKDERIKERMRVQSNVRRGKGGNVFLYVLLLCGLLWVMVKLSA